MVYHRDVYALELARGKEQNLMVTKYGPFSDDGSGLSCRKREGNGSSFDNDVTVRLLRIIDYSGI